MIAVDTNVLVYAHRQDSPFHEPAAAAMRDLAESASTWAIPWTCLHEFYAVVTNRRIFAPPSTREQALDQIDAWCASPSVALLTESVNHLEILGDLIRQAHLTGPSVHDARIAATCLSHGVRELLTLDRDFSRFPALRTRSLLSG
ncbi:hypothetical protein SAMN05892883_1709 [Jatrophihabitans sp. GAS493]|uniref:type II toxin-antitoxin system VapC family toxin n=1 Tax=Jatrophihabitans sp. GAS493 TaxID=1907575 RepID=UPI000BB957C5|nr:TA system VapC family ribonuclease toxin [Jatrophihabitans sp. GAS493]SOD72304.1 hypothetical protein SAMN05892883_1709 [Jatrophihabitans sp. GAS493]